ncbi:MAG: hypothetical protein VX519_07310, partial [Myxococcota bacterium]|nr:hypothetical protein [Myxococcota bacterium]
MSVHRARLRRLALGSVVCVGVAGGGFAAGVGWLASPGGNAWLQAQIEEIVTETLQEGRFELGGLRTNVLSELSVDQLGIVDGAGRSLLVLDELVLDYKLMPLLWREVAIRRVGVDGLVIELEQDAQGVWDFQRMFPASSEASESESWTVDVGIAEVGGQSISLRMNEQQVNVGPHRVELSGHFREGGLEIDVRGLEAELVEPALGAVTLSALGTGDSDTAQIDVSEMAGAGVALSLEALVEGLSGTPTGEVALNPVSVDVETLGRLLNLEVPLQGEIDGGVQIRGDGRLLELQGDLKLGVGAVEIDAQIEGWQEVPDWEVGLQLSEVDPALVLADLEPSRLTGRITATGRGWVPGPDTEIELLLEPGLCLGVELDALELTAQLQEDGFQISRLHFDSSLGRIDADGLFVEDHFRGEVSASVPDLSVLKQFGVNDLGGSAKASGRLDWGVGDSSVHFEGEMRGSRVRVSDGVVMREAQGPIQLSWKEGILRGSGRTQARGLEMEEMRLGDASIEWSGNFEEDSFDVEGFLKAGGLEAAGVRVGAFAGKFRAGASSPLEMELDMRLREASWQGLRADDGLLRLNLSSDQLMAVELALEHDQESLLVGSGQAHLDTRRLEVKDLVLSPQGYDPWSLVSPASLVWHEDGVTDVVVEMSSASGMLAVRGGGRSNGRVEGRVAIEGLQLDWLNSLFELPGWRGAVDADLQVSGTTDAMLLDAHLFGERLVIPDTLGGLNVEVELRTPRPGLAELVLQGSQKNLPLGRLEGTFPLGLGTGGRGVGLGELLWVQPEEPMRATAVVNPVAIRQLETLFPAVDFLPMGRVSSECFLGGTPANPKLEWRSGWEVRLDSNNSSTRLDLDLVLENGGLLVDGMVHQGGMRRVRLDGGIQTRLLQYLEGFWAGSALSGFEELDGWVSELDLELVP